MAKPREKVPVVELSSAFQKKAHLEFERLRQTVARNLKEEILGLLEDEIHSDLLITSGAVSVRAHKCIVQARCRHLWREDWLTLIQDPDTDSEISCLEMQGLNGEQLMQFARQLYSVSDTALLLEEYLKYMPGCRESSSLLEQGFDTTTAAEFPQPESEDLSCCSLLADTIIVKAEKKHIISERTSQHTDGEERQQTEPDRPVALCDVIDSGDEGNKKSITEGHPGYSDIKIVSLPNVPPESKIVCAESKTAPMESKIVCAEIKTAPMESKTVCAQSKTAPKESTVVGEESKHISSADDSVESEITLLSIVPAESKPAHTESRFVPSSDVSKESNIVCTDSKIVYLAEIPREKEIVSSTNAVTEKIVQIQSPQAESKAAPTESKTASSESQSAQAESKTAPTESKTAPMESKTAPMESKTAPTESKTAPTESKTAPTESRGLSSPEVNTVSETASTENKTASSESQTAPTENKTAPTESKTAPTESKTAPAESKSAPTESKTAPTESKSAPTESKTAPAESKTAPTESKTAPTESKTAPTQSKTAPTDSKTAATESKGLSSPEVHTVSETASTENKIASSESHTSPTENKTAPTESKTSPTEYKTSPTESKTAPKENKTAPTEYKISPTGSKTAPTESKTTPTESKTAPTEYETAPTESKTSPTESKTSPTENKTAATESKTAPTEYKMSPTESKTAPTESKTAPTESKTAPTESKTAPTESKTAPTECKMSPTECKMSPTEYKMSPTESKIAPTENKTAPTEYKMSARESKTVPTSVSSSQSSDICQVASSSSVDGEGLEVTDFLVHPEMVRSSVFSTNNLVKPRLLHEVIGCSILNKDRLELLDYLQLEAEIVNSASPVDDTSGDSCVAQDLINSDMLENLHDSAENRDRENGDGCLQMTSEVLTETFEPVSHEKESFHDLVTSDTAADEYKTCSPLGRDLLNMFLHKDNCDCCLSVDGIHFMAHKCVLSARCEYFLAMFGGQWSESQLATVNLEAVTPQAVKQLLLFLYGGVISLCVPSNLKELFIIADMYGVLTFRAVLAFYVKKDLCHFFHKPCPACVTTTSEALVLCHSFHLEDLQARCLKWMSKYFTKVWPTKTFSQLEDSIHQLCFESILSEITASNVLDIIIECNKLISSLPRIKWTETVLYLVTRLMESAIEYTSSHFVDVLKTKEFLLWAKVASWKASVLEEIFYSVINSLPVDAACLVFQTLIKLQELHSDPESPDVEITALLQAMIKCCEKFFRTHIHHVTRSKQWAVLPQPTQARILEMSAYVYLPEPPRSMSSRPFANKPQVGKHERTPPIGITGTRNRSAASSAAISAPARTGLISKTSPHSGRRSDKSREIRMSRSISESLPSRSQKTVSSLKGTEVKVRASSRDRHRVDSFGQVDGPGKNDSQKGCRLVDLKLITARSENQGTVLADASHFGYQSFSQGSRPGAYFMSESETKKDDALSLQDGVTENVLETEGQQNLQQVSHSLKLTLSSQSKPGSGAKKLSPVGQKSHMTSKLPTLIRSQRQPHKQQSVSGTHSEVLAPEHSISTSLEKLPSVSSGARNEVIASESLSSQSNEVIPPEYSPTLGPEGAPIECPPTISDETILPKEVTTSAPLDLFSTVTVGEGSDFVKGAEEKASVLPAASLDDDSFCDLPLTLPELAAAQDLTLNLKDTNGDHCGQPADSFQHFPSKLHKDTSLGRPENSNKNSQELNSNSQDLNSNSGDLNSNSRELNSNLQELNRNSRDQNSNSLELNTAETYGTLHFSSYTSDAILSERTGDSQVTTGVETAAVAAEVKIVHMSKTLNVGFIVPPD